MPVPTTQVEFLRRLGFEANPFQFTNADQEPRLNEYFVAPPYFASVYGDPSQPSSCMVFAPRGAGKSAQRRMVEMTAPEETVLCVTYDSFRNPTGGRLVDMKLNDHLLNVARITTIGLLTWLGQRPQAIERLSESEKLTLRALSVGLLSGITQAELRTALGSLRNLSERAKDIWNEHRWALNAVLSSINVTMGGPGGGILPQAEDARRAAGDPQENFELLGRLARQAGLEAVYILIDRVDESEETNTDPWAAYSMMSSLMHELEILEHAPFAFKFFLPDSLLEHYQSRGGRSDRVRNYQTNWKNAELDDIMSRRMSAYSNGRVTSPHAMLVGEETEVRRLTRLILLFANRSPRDFIRIWGRAVDEQLRIDTSLEGASPRAVIDGIDKFCSEKADEIATQPVMRDLKRVSRVDFTVTEVASDIFHIEKNSARARIQGWDNIGVVRHIGEIAARRGRPHRHYGIVDARVARACFPDVQLEQFLAAKARLCGNCESWVLRDWDDPRGDRDETCVECGIPLESVE